MKLSKYLSRKQKVQLKELKQSIRRKLQDAFYHVTTTVAVGSAKLAEFIIDKLKK